MRNPYSIVQWLAWLGAALVAAASLVSFAYTTFEPAETHRRDVDTITAEHRRDVDGIEHTLELMNGKLDDLLVRTPRQRR